MCAEFTGDSGQVTWFGESPALIYASGASGQYCLGYSRHLAADGGDNPYCPGTAA